MRDKKRFLIPFLLIFLLLACCSDPAADTSDTPSDPGEEQAFPSVIAFRDREHILRGDPDELEKSAPAFGAASHITYLLSYIQLLSFTEKEDILLGYETRTSYGSDQNDLRYALTDLYPESFFQDHDLILYRICDNVGVRYDTREIRYDPQEGRYEILIDYTPGQSEVMVHEICMIEVEKGMFPEDGSIVEPNFIFQRIRETP